MDFPTFFQTTNTKTYALPWRLYLFGEYRMYLIKCCSPIHSTYWKTLQKSSHQPSLPFFHTWTTSHLFVFQAIHSSHSEHNPYTTHVHDIQLVSLTHPHSLDFSYKLLFVLIQILLDVQFILLTFQTYLNALKVFGSSPALTFTSSC